MKKLIIEDLSGTSASHRYKIKEVQLVPGGLTSGAAIYLVANLDNRSSPLEHQIMQTTDGYFNHLVGVRILGIDPVGMAEVQFIPGAMGPNGNFSCDCRRRVPLDCLFEYMVLPLVKVIEKISIGSDIEFHYIKKGGEVISSERALIRSSSGEIGSDHGGSIGEIRPQFAYDPVEHADNIEKVLRKLIEGGMLNEDVFLDSSHSLNPDVSPAGGHIHFGIRDGNLIQKCAMNLDYWLLPTIQPLFPREVFLNRLKSYGRLGGESVRTNDHGFEYRNVPSFLFNKGIATGILCLAYAIVKLTVEGKLKVRIQEVDSNFRNKLFKDYNDYELTELNEMREENLKKLLNKNLLGGLVKYINPLFQAIKFKAEFSGDIAEGWGMEYEYVLNSRNQDELLQEGLTSGQIINIEVDS